MSNTRKQAFKRMQELRQQKIGNTKITELVDEFWRRVEEKSIDLSRWDGQGSPWQHRHILD